MTTTMTIMMKSRLNLLCDRMKLVFLATRLEKWLKSTGSSAWTVICWFWESWVRGNEDFRLWGIGLLSLGEWSSRLWGNIILVFGGIGSLYLEE